MIRSPTDWPQDASALLLRWAPAALAPPGRLATLAQALIARRPGLVVRTDCQVARDGSRTHLYFWTRAAAALDDALMADARALAAELPRAEVVRLHALEERPTVSATRDAPFHYVVETDAEPADARAVRDWYAGEHLAGLAACDGAVRARRLANVDGGPASFACYELVSPAVLETPAWLAVRATDWAARVRPLLRNTRRTMFERAFTF